MNAPRVLIALALALPIASLALATDSLTVHSIEPPGWWPAHSLRQVRLLVRGRGLTEARLSSSRPDLQVSDVRVNERGTALFATLTISPESRPGPALLLISTPHGQASPAFSIEAPGHRLNATRGVDQHDVIYEIMVDRFANGDTSNDRPRGDPEAVPVDRDDPRGFHGGDLQGVIDRLDYLQDLGVTTLWLTPWYDNHNGRREGDEPWLPATAYHGYHPTSFYRVEDHFGNLPILLKLVEAAHLRGMKVIQDQILNHVGFHHPWVADPPTPTWFHGTPEHHDLNTFAIDSLVSTTGSETARREALDGWFTDELPDLNQDDPEVASYLIQNALWWAATTGIDGIRLDTAPYIPRPFLAAYAGALHRQHPRLWIVGEVLHFDPRCVQFYLGGERGWDAVDTGLDSVFDFPAWNRRIRCCLGDQPMSRIIGYPPAERPPPALRERLVQLSGNHDLRRFPSWNGANSAALRLQLALVLAGPGIPQIYAGDELGLEGAEDPLNRQDFPGGFPGDPRNAFQRDHESPAQAEILEWVRSWLALRRSESALRIGTTTDLLADEETYVFSRRHGASHVLVALHRGFLPTIRHLPAQIVGARPGEWLIPRIGSAARPTRVGDDGVQLVLPPATVSAWSLSSNGP